MMFIAWIVLTIAVGMLANSRGKSALLYMFFSLILSPLLGWIVLMCQSNERLENEQERRHQELLSAAMKRQ